MKKWSVLVAGGMIVLIIALGIWSWAGVVRGEIVLNHGIGFYRAIRGILVALVLAGAALAFVGIYFESRAEKAERRRRQMVAPEVIRQGLRKAGSEHPAFPFDKVLRQMDRMDAAKSEVRKHLPTNARARAEMGAAYVGLEAEMCGDIRAFLNTMIGLSDEGGVLDDYEALLARNEDRLLRMEQLVKGAE